jgi:hypothetical protein
MAWVLMACLAAHASRAASPERQQPAQQAAQKKVDELGEVLVEATRQRARRPGFKAYESSFGWLARMVGTFVIDGTMDPKAQGRREDLRPVSGRAVCLGFGAAPGVQCELKLRWPGSTSPEGPMATAFSGMDPSAALFGLDLVTSGVSYILVDSNGIAETSIGDMVSADTMVSHARCGTIDGNCERITRFTASADLKTVTVSMELQVDQVKSASFDFVMHRVPGRPATVYGREQKKAKK